MLEISHRDWIHDGETAAFQEALFSRRGRFCSLEFDNAARCPLLLVYSFLSCWARVGPLRTSRWRLSTGVLNWNAFVREQSVPVQSPDSISVGRVWIVLYSASLFSLSIKAVCTGMWEAVTTWDWYYGITRIISALPAHSSYYTLICAPEYPNKY